MLHSDTSVTCNFSEFNDQPSVLTSCNSIKFLKGFSVTNTFIITQGLFVTNIQNDLLFRVLMQEDNRDPNFAFEYRGPITMKGKSEPMDVWFLTRANHN